MQPGNLVKVTQASIGTPKGTMGLVLKIEPSNFETDVSFLYCKIQICNEQQQIVRRLGRDLEVVKCK